MHETLVDFRAAYAAPILWLNTTTFTSQNTTSYHNIVLGKHQQDL